jgi:REP element-mobilizing transposase RayT
MKKYHVQPGNPVILSLDEEIIVVKNIAVIVKKNHYKIISFNICKDHIHLIIYCTTEELESSIKKIKAATSRKYHKTHSNKLWAQKFNRQVLEDEHDLENVINYIQYNRLKHGLPESEKLKKIINGMLIKMEDLYD